MTLTDFHAWAVFAAVADLRSFSGAAAALRLSKASVSKAVARLEAAHGAPLFHRTSRRLSLTESGERLAAHARRIVAAGEEADAAAVEDAALPTGLIRVAAPMSFGTDHVAPLVARFLGQHPGIAVDLSLNDARIDLIASGVDLALRIGALPDSSLRARRVRDITTFTVASPDYLRRHGTPLHPADLARHCCLVYSLSPTPETWRFSGPDGETAAMRPAGALKVNSGTAMLPALRDGLGIGVLPDFICGEDIAEGRLAAILPAWKPPPIALHIVTPPGRLRARRVELLIDFLAANLGPNRVPIPVT